MTTSTPSSSPATRHPERGRVLLPLQCTDLSAFAKSLRAQLAEHRTQSAELPGHVQLLNMLARAAGHRNVQSLKAHAASERVARAREALAQRAAAMAPPSAAPPVAFPIEVDEALPLTATAAKALTQFDDWGRLSRWPHKFSVQRLAMWALWIHFDSGRTYTEREVNEILKAWTTYGDHVTPRREMVEMKLLSRRPDGSAYWKEPQRPADEVRALIQALRQRRG